MRKPISGHHYTAADREMFERWPQGWYAALTVAEVRGQNVLQKSGYTADELLAEVQRILELVKNVLWPAGRAENSENQEAGL